MRLCGFKLSHHCCTVVVFIFGNSVTISDYDFVCEGVDETLYLVYLIYLMCCMCIKSLLRTRKITATFALVRKKALFVNKQCFTIFTLNVFGCSHFTVWKLLKLIISYV